MFDEERYFDELQKVINETKSADGISERLNEVLERLDQLSISRIRQRPSGRDGNPL